MRAKRAALVAITLLTVLLVAPAVVAGRGGGGGGGGEVATALGWITSIDDANMTFVIDVIKSNGLVDVDPLSILVTGSTHIKECLGDGVSVPIDFEDLDVGDLVRVDGTMDGDDLVARRITVNPENALP